MISLCDSAVLPEVASPKPKVLAKLAAFPSAAEPAK
jgi:hypothetical protein